MSDLVENSVVHMANNLRSPPFNARASPSPEPINSNNSKKKRHKSKTMTTTTKRRKHREEEKNIDALFDDVNHGGNYIG